MADIEADAPTSGKRANTKAANRRAILTAARRVFALIGYEVTTVRDIIRETNLASGTFYNYFKSKEEVFQAIAEDSTYRFRAHLSEVRARTNSLEDYIEHAFRAYFSFIARENEEAIKTECKATIRCYPLAENGSGMFKGKKCFYSGDDATHMALFGRAF